ncbi:MAG: hypothetical protein GC136_11210 [Alphaproteobacteria bacterium]|nr:hypothetical protein [Alphaproteobacteria bacterium]
MTLLYTLPKSVKESEEAFKALQTLLRSSQIEAQHNRFTLASAPDLTPSTSFMLEDNTRAASITLGNTPLPQSLLQSPVKQDCAMTLVEAAEKLYAHIIAVDHTGIIVPDKTITPKDWADSVNILAAKTMLYDYPASPEYDPEKSRWLFTLPATAQDDMKQRRLCQPKFELVWDKMGRESTIMQIDLETNLTRAEIAELLPASYELPSLGEFFRSINISVPWAGIGYIRLDLRYKEPSEINDWNSGNWFIQNGTRVKPDGPQSRLPNSVS